MVTKIVSYNELCGIILFLEICVRIYTRSHKVWGCFSDPFHGSQMQCPLQRCQLHHCPLNEVISRHTGADVAKKTRWDVIVIDAHLPPHPLHNLADGIRITTSIMWRQLSPWRLGSRRIGSRLISGRRRGSQLGWFTACSCRHHLETCVSVQLKKMHGGYLGGKKEGALKRAAKLFIGEM